MIERPEPPQDLDERGTLESFLDYYRLTLAAKCEGLDAEQLARRSVLPSGLSLLGLVRHLTEVERAWFREFDGQATRSYYRSDEEPDADLLGAAADPVMIERAFADWQREIEAARQIVASHELTRTYVHPRRGGTISLRWILVHLIEEYARHCGHADLLRERIDGVTGD